ncbi:LCP family protein [Candidatus Bipolaricaulota bacterium]
MRGLVVRKQVLIVAVVALAVAVGAVLWYVYTQRQVSQILAEDARTNLLLIGHDGAGVTDVLTLLSLTQDSLMIFSVPIGLLMKGPDGDLVAARNVYGRFDAPTVARMTGDLLGIDVPFYIAADWTTWAGWIDETGGTRVDVAETAIYVDQSVEPPLRIEIRTGTQPMSGDEAVAFAVSPAEPGGSPRIARQQALLRAVFGSGIRAPALRTVRSGLRDLHPALDTNCSLDDLLDLASVLRDAPGERVQTAVVPSESVTIDGAQWMQPKIVETERLVAAAIKGLDLLTPSDVRIAVFNGNGVRQMASLTAAYLRARGFVVTRVANADAFDYPTSYIIVLTTEAKAWILSDTLISDVQIVFPDTFADHYEALQEFIPADTDLAFIAGAGMELE